MILIVAVETEEDADSLYEGVDTANESASGQGSVDGVTRKQRSGTMNLENLTKDIKSDDIEGVIKKGM